MNHSYEIEIKSLLGSKDKAEELKKKMKAADPGLIEIGSHKQLNHYFVGGDLHRLYENVKNIIDADKKDKLAELAEQAKDFSVRTRWADGKVILVIKASVDDTTSSNGTARLEWESLVPVSIEELDKLILSAGFQYQAKWSRERQEFKYKDANVSIDKNAGYGYLSEFEMVIDDKDKAEQTKIQLRQMMKDLGLDELPQDRLARMFDFYNKNWEKYYGTENIFNIE
ncbi:MAG: CYTH domain-containing protein [Patescibacteria group bacterium]|nr:CYTH domain-containing protein [Patescibacteria group bacterium]